MTRDLEVTIRATVRVDGDGLASPRVTEALIGLLEHPDFRDGGHGNGRVFAINSDYVQVSYRNQYRTNGVPDLVHVSGWPNG